MRATPSRISPSNYPIAATATAPAYDFEELPEPKQALPEAAEPAEVRPDQQRLFSGGLTDRRVIPFDSLTSASERDAIRQRAEIQRPAPVRSARVEAKRVKPKRTAAAPSHSDQHRLEFQGQEEVIVQLRSHVMCDAPVANTALRVQAALLDASIIVLGLAIGVALFLYVAGHVSADKHILPFVGAAIFTVPLFYKLLWAYAGQDSLGTQMAGLELIDFDGRKPSRARRFGRLFGSFVSLLAAGTGMLWVFVDEDKLTWHDHMSSSFPTFSSEQ